jgi:ribosome-associated translation inhibitor RaiA
MREKSLTNPKLLVEVTNLESKAGVLSYINERADGVFRRYPSLEGIRINLKPETTGSRNSDFIAQIRLVLPGYDKIVQKRSSEVFEAISEVFDVADRQLRKRARLFKTRQRA